MVNKLLPVLYHSPSESIDGFFNILEKFLEEHNFSRKRIIAGDFNIDLLRDETARSVGGYPTYLHPSVWIYCRNEVKAEKHQLLQAV